MIDLTALALLTLSTIIEIALDANNWTLTICWALFCTSVSIALCQALHRIRQYSSSLTNSGLEASRGLLLAHQILFVSGSAMNVTSFFLLLTEEIEDEKPNPNMQEIERLYISEKFMNIFAQLLWFTVHMLMLRIFIKYGKPLEDDR